MVLLTILNRKEKLDKSILMDYLSTKYLLESTESLFDNLYHPMMMRLAILGNSIWVTCGSRAIWPYVTPVTGRSSCQWSPHLTTSALTMHWPLNIPVTILLDSWLGQVQSWNPWFRPILPGLWHRPTQRLLIWLERGPGPAWPCGWNTGQRSRWK